MGIVKAINHSDDILELSPVMVKPHKAIEVDLEKLNSATSIILDSEIFSVQVINKSGTLGLVGALCNIDLATRTTYDVILRR